MLVVCRDDFLVGGRRILHPADACRFHVPAFFHRDAARLVRDYDPRLFPRAEKVGIRPQLVDWRTKELVMDFLVESRDGSVHVLNPISPAFTSSMALARAIVEEHLG